MQRARDWYIVRSITAALLCGSLLLSSCQSVQFFEDGYQQAPASSAHTAVTPTVRSLARDIDLLERHIERYGSVTVKQPDVWGQARLTLIRNEFETTMKADLGNFTQTLQGTFSASDQAYLVNALALSAAASGTQQVLRPAPTAVSNVSTATGSSTGAGTPISPTPLPQFSDFNSNVFGAFGQITRNPATLPNFLGFGANATIALEPTIVEEQKARYLNALHELRRINEGDDTADSPGYSLNLVRLPVSILPGQRTDVGYGAELTMTMTPRLGDELLPTTFRNLVLNDLVDQISFPATQFINNPDNGPYLDPRRAADLDELLRLLDRVTIFDQTTPADDVNLLKTLRLKLSLAPIFTRPEWLWVDPYLKSRDEFDQIQTVQTANQERLTKIETVYGEKARKLTQGTKDLRQMIEANQDFKKAKTDLQNATTELQQTAKLQAASSERMRAGLSKQTAQLRAIQSFSIPSSKSRRARMPFPPTEMPEIYGYSLVFDLASEIFGVFQKEQFSYPCPSSPQMVIHLPDVQGHLQEQLAAVEKLLQQPCNVDLWQFCNPELVTAVRNRAVQPLRDQRNQFLSLLQTKAQSAAPISPTVAALTWATIVESALLTDQLILDMKESAAAQGIAAPEQKWFDYYLPKPSPEARAAFNEYVRIRWPIHIFALDPVQQQQNIGTTFSGRREMQMALSIGFVNGQVSAQDMMRYARRVEFDAQTIDLNGTTVGFSNGNDTFGWRFYPRFQTPEIQSNATVLFQDLIMGGPTRNDLLHQRRLEPGIRECDAIVIMPSFVPYAALEVSSNWFSLINPRKKDLNATYAMRLSHQVKSIQNFEGCVRDGDQYRDGDLSRLFNKVQQLESRLPFQSMSFQVPYENTLGGFGMFNTGVTDLSPELTGWYGAPSINPAAATTVFLTGDHFSVLQTSVIAGGQQLPPAAVQMLSRQVLQATIPTGTLQIGKNGENFVDVQVATPYGVTQHLLIPVCAATTAADSTSGVASLGPSWKAPSVTLAYTFGGLGIVPPTVATDPKVRPTSLLVLPGPIDPTQLDTVTVTIKLPKAMSSGNAVLGPYKYDSTQNGYPVSGDDMSTQVFSKIGAYYGPTAFPPPEVDAATSLQFSSSKGAFPSQKVDSANKLAITWIQATASK